MKRTGPGRSQHPGSAGQREELEGSATPPKTPLPLHIERLVYGGFGVGRDAGADMPGKTWLVPLTLSGERVEALPRADGREAEPLAILEPSPARVAPGCPHFGACGGCHLQMASYPEQLRLKREVLLEGLQRAGLNHLPEPSTHAAEPWSYRNRIRLRLETDAGERRFGYTGRGGGAALRAQPFLPIRTCPIAAPLLWRAAEAMLATAAINADLRRWMDAAREVEFFTDSSESKLQLTLLCPAAPKLAARELAPSFAKAMSALAGSVGELAGAGAVAASWAPLRLGENLAEWGAPGLTCTVSHAGVDERYWAERGGFFQVNRFLLATLLDLVCDGRAGKLAWDLYAGVGLFSRVLARRFDQVVAVEPHPASYEELSRGLGHLRAAHRAEQRTTVDFLRGAILQRDRPGLVVLDPPRAGAGPEVCDLLLRVGAPEVVYVSCDPVTLARDLAVLTTRYTIEALHLVDLFPQTYHQEAVVTLTLRP